MSNLLTPNDWPFALYILGIIFISVFWEFILMNYYTVVIIGNKAKNKIKKYIQFFLINLIYMDSEL